MKKPLLIIGGIEAAIIAIAALIAGTQSHRYDDYALGIGILSLALAGIDILVGFILVLAGLSNEPTKKAGLAFLICGGVMLLASFTFCGTGLSGL